MAAPDGTAPKMVLPTKAKEGMLSLLKDALDRLTNLVGTVKDADTTDETGAAVPTALFRDLGVVANVVQTLLGAHPAKASKSVLALHKIAASLAGVAGDLLGNDGEGREIDDTTAGALRDVVKHLNDVLPPLPGSTDPVAQLLLAVAKDAQAAAACGIDTPEFEAAMAKVIAGFEGVAKAVVKKQCGSCGGECCPDCKDGECDGTCCDACAEATKARKAREAAKKVDCETCAGTGKVDGEPCPDCAGTGKVEKAEEPPADACPKCKGAGKLFGKPCPDCEGTGKVAKAAGAPCEACKGTGKVGEKPCEKCAGKGTVAKAASPDRKLRLLVKGLMQLLHEIAGTDLADPAQVAKALDAAGATPEAVAKAARLETENQELRAQVRALESTPARPASAPEQGTRGGGADAGPSTPKSHGWVL